jgi:hypothetical protein
VIDDEQIRVCHLHAGFQLFELATANESTGMRMIPGSRDRFDHIHPCRAGKLNAFTNAGVVINGCAGLTVGITKVNVKNDCFAAGFWTIEKQGCS